MITRGLIWYHWQIYLENDYAVRVYSVTKAGQQYFATLFSHNVRDRVHGNLGDGTFLYEGAQAKDDRAITIWRFTIYGGLVFCEDLSAPETHGSQVIVITGPQRVLEGNASVVNEPEILSDKSTESA